MHAVAASSGVIGVGVKVASVAQHQGERPAGSLCVTKNMVPEAFGTFCEGAFTHDDQHTLCNALVPASPSIRSCGPDHGSQPTFARSQSAASRRRAAGTCQPLVFSVDGNLILYLVLAPADLIGASNRGTCQRPPFVGGGPLLRGQNTDCDYFDIVAG